MKALKIRKLDPKAVVPKTANPGDAGFDLVAISREYDNISNCWVYDTGLAVEIPEGHFGMVVPRSSIYKTDLTLRNSVGVIDEGYRGSIKAMFKANSVFGNKLYVVGDRIAQLVIVPYTSVIPVEVAELQDTKRGTGGFGSSGK